MIHVAFPLVGRAPGQAISTKLRHSWPQMQQHTYAERPSQSIPAHRVPKRPWCAWCFKKASCYFLFWVCFLLCFCCGAFGDCFVRSSICRSGKLAVCRRNKCPGGHFQCPSLFQGTRACVPKDTNQLDHTAKTKTPAAGRTNMREAYHNQEGSKE